MPLENNASAQILHSKKKTCFEQYIAENLQGKYSFTLGIVQFKLFRNVVSSDYTAKK